MFQHFVLSDDQLHTGLHVLDFCHVMPVNLVVYAFATELLLPCLFDLTQILNIVELDSLVLSRRERFWALFFAFLLPESGPELHDEGIGGNKCLEIIFSGVDKCFLLISAKAGGYKFILGEGTAGAVDSGF